MHRTVAWCHLQHIHKSDMLQIIRNSGGRQLHLTPSDLIVVPESPRQSRSGLFAPGTLRTLFEALDEIQGQTPRELHQRVQHLALSTVRVALLELTRRGMARSEGEMGRRIYLKVARRPINV